MESLYKILEINATNDLKTIKKAYITKVKTYPPETHPKEFEKIRDAYERLSKYVTNESTTIEVISEEPNNENKYITKAQEFFKLKEYDKALIAYERALIECDEKSKILNEIGVIYIHKDEVDKAIFKFEEVLKEDSKSDVAYANLGDAYLKKENYDLARLNYKKAYELNNNSEYIKSILDTYVKSKDPITLLDSLNKFENKFKLTKGNLATYYISCINLFIEYKHEEKLKEVLEMLVKNESLDITDSKEISEQLYRTGLLLYKNKHYKIANLICEYG
ncbi:MAG: DnaJ domain-containing protein, partial [Romboutsia sp.]|nr:DnaJ domain-containing protein [Romboutsia sp.]